MEEGGAEVSSTKRLALDANILLLRAAFGCGIATWTSNRTELYLRDA
jgi:hypothetical protein